MIYARIEHCIMPYTWFLTCACGHPSYKDKNDFWSLLESMADTIVEPWIITGDLNEVLQTDEEMGRRSVGSSSQNHLERLCKKWVFQI